MTTSDNFRIWGKEMVDYISRYQDGIEDRPALAQVAPGYLLDQMPADAPQKPDEWNDVLVDVERLIMPGVRISQIEVITIVAPKGHANAKN